jgi:ribosomal protein S12 methylthiotransferase
MGNSRYWLTTLGCPKNQVDSDKLEGLLTADGYSRADEVGEADLVVVNTCAFIDAARQESVDVVLELADARRPGARLVVTGCMAERYGDELRAALPEVDLVAGFGASLTAPQPVAVCIGTGPAVTPTVRAFDLLALPRPASDTPWAYVKVAEGCDRICGFCAIPSFRGKQRSRHMDDVLAEIRSLAAGDDTHDGVAEIVLVAQDLASYGRDRSASGTSGRARGTQPIVELVRAATELVERTRLLYLYPSGLTDDLVEAMLAARVAYFDLSLQHVSRPLLARMRRWGDGERFVERIEAIRSAAPEATFRSSFILGYPGETEEDHDRLLEFLRAAELDWAGFFTFSPEDGTYAEGLGDQVPAELALERLRECAELQDAITAQRRDALVGAARQVLIDAPGIGRTIGEAPEIDGIVRVDPALPVGRLVDMVITASLGTDLEAVAATALAHQERVPAGRGAA